MLRAIAYGFRNVLNLDGRDRRRVFWPFAIALALLVYLPLFVFMVGFFHPFGDDFLEADRPLTFLPWIGGIFALVLIGVLLVFAACVRRLHDSGASMRTAVIVFGSLAVVYVLMLAIPFLLEFGDWAELPRIPMIAYTICLFAFGFIANFGFFWLLYLLLRRGTPGDNRYGPPPPKQLGAK